MLRPTGKAARTLSFSSSVSANIVGENVAQGTAGLSVAPYGDEPDTIR